MSTSFRQDMPPEGGYRPIQYERVKPKTVFRTGALLLGFLPVWLWSMYQTLQARKFGRKLDIEKYDTLLACEPFMQAERERAFLRQLHKLRKDESELMKNVPGWTVGTLYGTPQSVTEPADILPNLPPEELYAHRHKEEIYNYIWPEKDLV